MTLAGVLFPKATFRVLPIRTRKTKENLLNPNLRTGHSAAQSNRKA